MPDDPMPDESSVAGLARDIRDARDRLITCVDLLPDGAWATALSRDDPRPIGIVCDHVAHSYEYLGGWVSELVSGREVAVTSGVVDELNARHAQAPLRARGEVTAHIRQSCETLLELVGRLGPDDLERRSE